MSSTSVMMNAPAGMRTSIGWSGWSRIAALLFTAPSSRPRAARGRAADSTNGDGRPALFCVKRPSGAAVRRARTVLGAPGANEREPPRDRIAETVDSGVVEREEQRRLDQLRFHEQERAFRRVDARAHDAVDPGVQQRPRREPGD